MNKSAKGAQYKFLPFLAMLSITLSLIIHLFRVKYIWLNNIEVANFIIPFWYIMNDLIAEIYGYKISMKIFYYGIFCGYGFLGIYYFVMYLPSPNYSQESFYYMLGHTWDEFIFNPIALLIAWSVNARLLIKWKMLLKGKYFWMRSIGSSIISQIFYTIIIFPKFLLFFNMKQALDILMWGSIFCVSFMVFFAFPSSLIAMFLKIIEQTDSRKNSDYFNPFKKEKSAEI